MELKNAVDFIKNAVIPVKGTWADIGAGSGIYTQALDQVLEAGSIIYAADKNPHMLYRLRLENCELRIEELDFTRPFTLPPLDGIIMANALHYAPDPEPVLEKIVACLKPGGRLLMIEYETERPLQPWIPYPIPFQRFREMAASVGLQEVRQEGQIPSAYGHDHIYLAVAER
ncbi:class I SAM-dependent methyltransferase [Flavilitoribacter nigricans]|nr:class I SAM-dependent methyltransferase [Flavilitoribacter nigricans]